MLNAPLDPWGQSQTVTLVLAKMTFTRRPASAHQRLGKVSFGLAIPGTQGIIATEATGVVRGQNWLEGPDQPLR